MGISPGIKWTTKHHFQDPMLSALSDDAWLEVVGIIVFGSGAGNDEKLFNSKRAAMNAISACPDGIMLEVDGFGNNHVDWMNCIDYLGRAKIPLVGVTFKGVNDFVVTSKYIKDSYIDTDHAHALTDTLCVGQNCVSRIDAIRAVALLKRKIIEKK